MRRSALRWLRFGLVPVLLVVAAIAIGGVPGILLGFLAGLLVTDRIFDRVIGSTGFEWLDADRRYQRVARQRRRAHAPPCEYLPDDTGWAATAQRRRLGLQEVALASIVGSSDRHKAEAFDAAFRPPEWSRGRWTLLYLAAQRGTTLPPISVYRVGDRHYVRDGHHRVSVALARDNHTIDAEVTELISAAAPRPQRSSSDAL
jgi:hypothetical protein